MPKEAAVDPSISGLDVWTEDFAVVPARVEQLAIVMVIIGLQLGHTQQLLLAQLLQLLKLRHEAAQRPSLVMW